MQTTAVSQGPAFAWKWWKGRSLLVSRVRCSCLGEGEMAKTVSVKGNCMTRYLFTFSLIFLHPCMSVELLVFNQIQTTGSTSLATEAQTQQGFLDERASIADPSRTVDDDQDDGMAEPTQTMRAEKRKMDETAKELRALLPITTFSHASSTRPEDETHEQLARFTIQARIARMSAEASQDVSSMFLRARTVDVHGEDKEKMLGTKSGERKFYFAYRSSKMQVSRVTRRAIRETQMSFGAVVILTDGKTRQPTGASRENSLMQWIDTDEKTHLRGGNDYVHVLAKH